MVRRRSQNEIIQALLDFLRIAQPNLDTKPGTVSRDLIIDAPATQLGKLYDELARVATLQSLRLALGSDLDKLGANFGATRRRGSKASGPALLTFSEIVGDISINAGDIVTAKNGATFIVTNGLVVSPVFSNSFRAKASQFKSELDFASITDEFAAEILIEATAVGTQGNISKFSLVSTQISGVNNVTNVVPFGGGQAPEDDAAFRSKVLAIFSGANTGTSLGYKNAVLEDPAAIDAVVIEPGDVLMTRDGTQVTTAEDGTKSIISEGTGGKVDIYTFGFRLQEVIDSFIYRDLSNTDDPTNILNDFVLGQIDGDENKTVTRRRLENLENGELPQQPVNNIIEVSGTLSGSNFIEKSVDTLGRISGNYELIKDTGAFGGSPWGFDKLHWISDRISNFKEDKTKGSFNGQDSLAFTDILKIGSIEQNITVTNENSKVISTDKSLIQLSHFPITNVTRVFNVTTGERYVIVDQNPDSEGSINKTGKIKIRGSSLPSVSDILQVDYTWVFKYDANFDFDNRTSNTNPRSVQDSVDWGFSNAIRRENATLLSSGSILIASATHPISSVINVNTFVSESDSVVLTSGRLSTVVTDSINNVISVVRDSDGTELWNTNKKDGTFSGFTIFLPTDTAAILNDTVSIVYNAVDVFNLDGYEGSFSENQISIVPSEEASAGKLVEINYIANINTLLPSTILSSLPAIRSNNAFNTTLQSNIGSQPTTHVFSDPGVVVKNLRIAPSRLGITISGSISPGVLTITGTTIKGVFDVVYTVGTEGLKQNLTSAIRTSLGVNSKGTIPSNLKISKLVKMEKVETSSSLEVLSVINEYDIKGYHVKDNTFSKDESVSNSTLLPTEVLLPTTTNNVSNEPNVGDRVRATFYYVLEEDLENVNFSKSGTLYTNKIFAIIDSVVKSSGFTSGSSSAATLTIFNQNQPNTSSRYSVLYDYTAPKANERINIRFNYNRLMGDATLNVENTRPINADVLVKDSVSIPVDIEIRVVVTAEFINNTNTVQQNVQDALTAALNANRLGTIIDSSDLANVAGDVDGVDRVRVTFFNKADIGGGSVLSISASKNERIVANEVTVIIESR